MTSSRIISSKKTQRKQKKQKKNLKKHKKSRRRNNVNVFFVMVFGKIYSNGCGHCQAMEEDWKALEQKMHPIKSVNIESANQHTQIPEFNRQYRTNLSIQSGYPTIFQIDKHKKLRYYNGGRSTQEMSEWLEGKRNDAGEYIHKL
jgi:hypothetical protein